MTASTRATSGNGGGEPIRLIVNADDFGYSAGVNRGIVEAHERGIVTSASLMVDEAGAEAAAAYARGHDLLGVGLHVDLEGWWWRLPPPLRRGLDRPLLRHAARELRRQLERFRALVGADPTHLDSHKHRHRADALRPLFLAHAAALGVPLRQFDSRVRFCGTFYGQVGAARPNPSAVAPEALVSLLESLPPGITELGSHPGYADDLDDSYRAERALEVSTLCDPSVRAAVDRLGITLISFREVPA